MNYDEFPLDVLPSGHTGEFEPYVLKGYNDMSKDDIELSFDDRYSEENFVVEISPCSYEVNLPVSCGVQINPDAYPVADHQAMKEAFDTSDIVFTSSPEGITLEREDDLVNLVGNVVQWHYDRNLIEGSTDKDQYCKLMQEAGELSDSICKQYDVRDDIGDMLVVLINIAERNNLSLGQCLKRAWDDIKNRKGRMVDGVFIKESDL